MAQDSREGEEIGAKRKALTVDEPTQPVSLTLKKDLGSYRVKRWLNFCEQCTQHPCCRQGKRTTFSSTTSITFRAPRFRAGGGQALGNWTEKYPADRWQGRATATSNCPQLLEEKSGLAL